MVEPKQENHWLEQSRNGDHASFENLIRGYQKMIHSLAYRMTGSMADADDLTQETFIRAFQQLTSGSVQHDAHASNKCSMGSLRRC